LRSSNQSSPKRTSLISQASNGTPYSGISDLHISEEGLAKLLKELNPITKRQAQSHAGYSRNWQENLLLSSQRCFVKL